MNIIFKALNDPTRRAILEMLQQKDMTAGEIAEQFHISFPSISHHLDLLKQANLVVAEKEGQFVFFINLIPWIYLATIWAGLPDRIPVHFGIDGTPDKYGERNQVFFIPATCTVVSVLVYLLLTNIYKLDPKGWVAKQPGIFLKISMVVVVFISCMSIIVLNWTASQHTGGLNLVLVM